MPDIPEAVAIAQPILYLFVIYTIVVIGVFVALLRWIVDRFISALDMFGNQIMDKLDMIDNKLDNNQNNNRKRGF